MWLAPSGRFSFSPGFTLVPRTGRAPGASPTPRLLSLKFAWEDDAVVGKSGLPVKSVSTLFIGTSPDYVFAAAVGMSESFS